MNRRGLALACGLMFSGCLNTVAEADCWSDLDCGADMTCVDSRCSPSLAVQSDAGRVTVDAGYRDAGTVDSGAPDAAVSDAGPIDAGQFDAGPSDAGPSDAGSFDAGQIDAGAFDAGAFDAGQPDAGPIDAGVDAGVFDAGPPPCSTMSPCLPTGYKFELSPECGVFCYYDEAHNLAINGPGQGQNPAGFGQYASGQLLDGVRGSPDWTVNNGFEWVGWLYREAGIVFQFATSRAFSSVRVGVNNRGNGAVIVPPEIRVQFGDDGVNFGGAYTFRSADGTLPPVPLGARLDVTLPLAGAAGRFVRFTLVNPSAWSMVDEFEFH